MNDDFIQQVERCADEYGIGTEPAPLGYGGLSIARVRSRTPLKATSYTPLLCLVLQGEKQTRFKHESLSFGAGQVLVVSIDTPSVSQVTRASRTRPYVALAVDIDLSLLREVSSELNSLPRSGYEDAASMKVEGASEALQDSVRRLFHLHDSPMEERQFMSPLLRREIHFRLLFESRSGMLHRLMKPESHESRINQAIVRIRKAFDKPLSVPELAQMAAMSVSSFHAHFKAITGTSPLQFQKDLRLLAAQQSLATGADSIASVAYRVGYDSMPQFSREYARRFGYPPSCEARS